jgi:hypothetical protein
VLQVADACLLQVAELRLGERLLAHLSERHLNRVVAVALGTSDPGHEAGARLDDGHALDAAVLRVEDLGHAEFSSEESRHNRLR